MGAFKYPILTGLLRYANLGDFHTHTIYSLHAMSSPQEMVEAAKKQGLSYIAITDHVYPMESRDYGVPSYDNEYDKTAARVLMNNQKARMWEYPRQFADCGIHVIPGNEFSNFTTLCGDYSDGIKAFNLVGLHSWYYRPHTTSIENYFSNLTQFANWSFKISCIAHPEREIMGIIKDDDKVDDFFKRLVNLCATHGLLMEVNESSLREPNEMKRKQNEYLMKIWLKYAKQAGINIVINTDSHISYTVGRISNSLKLLDEIGYDEDRIVNFDRDKIKDLILHEYD